MIRSLLLACLMVCSGLLFAQQPTPGASLLFKGVKSATTTGDRNEIFRQLGLELSAAKNGFRIGEYEIAVTVYPVDLNKDGKEELFIDLGSPAMYGMTGSTAVLFIKQADGHYKIHNEISGVPMVMKTTSKGYPDIALGGPGFEFPLMRWNGKEYTYFKAIKDGALTGAADMETVSRAYTSTLK